MIGWYNGWSPEERLATVPAQREAMRDGRLSRPTICSICGVVHRYGGDAAIWFHDEDYADPLGAYAVCRLCHRTLHERFEAPDKWQAVIDAHGRDGSAWFERLTLDPASLRQPFALTYPEGLPRPT